jgi:hypothetical protein
MAAAAAAVVARGRTKGQQKKQNNDSVEYEQRGLICGLWEGIWSWGRKKKKDKMYSFRDA